MLKLQKHYIVYGLQIKIEKVYKITSKIVLAQLFISLILYFVIK